MEIIKKNADIFEYVGRDEAYLDVTKRVDEDFKKASHLAQQIKIQKISRKLAKATFET